MTALAPNANFLPNLLLNPKGRPHMDAELCTEILSNRIISSRNLSPMATG